MIAPLVVPLIPAVIGGLVGHVLLSSLPMTGQWRRPVVLAVSILGVAAALIPNAGQQLYDVGISFDAVAVLDGVSYALLGGAVVGLWSLLVKRWQRWLYAAIVVPTAFAQPLLWMFAYTAWTIWGFAP
jgi:hypothetical protein